jgi:hypothetical protein
MSMRSKLNNLLGTAKAPVWASRSSGRRCAEAARKQTELLLLHTATSMIFLYVRRALNKESVLPASHGLLSVVRAAGPGRCNSCAGRRGGQAGGGRRLLEPVVLAARLSRQRANGVLGGEIEEQRKAVMTCSNLRYLRILRDRRSFDDNRCC